MNTSIRSKAILAGLGLMAAGCALGRGDPTPTPTPEAEFVPVVSATGQVVPVEWASLSLAGSGVVDALPVAEGDLVGKGELLLQLSGREQLEAALAAAQLAEIEAQQALDRVLDEEGLMRALAQDALATA